MMMMNYNVTHLTVGHPPSLVGMYLLINIHNSVGVA